MTDEAQFEHASNFEKGETSGNVRLGKLESMYEELFAEVIEDGVITLDERVQLDKMADNFGLDRGRLRRLEAALQAAYEAQHKVVIKDMSFGDEAPPQSIAPLEPATDQRTLALERRIKWLEGRLADVERELEDARAHISVEVDFSDVTTEKEVPEDDPADLMRRLRIDPRDEPSLRALLRLYQKANDHDRAFCVAGVLSFIGAARPDEKEYFEKRRVVGLIRPRASVTPDAWRKLLAHPDEEPLIGDIFAVVVGAVLIGRLSALRRDKQLPKPDPAKKHDPAVSTLQAVRCFSWASAILGMGHSMFYVDTDFDGFVEMIPAVPPASKLGAKALAGRSAAELAFLAGRHLAHFREEHFVKLLVPSAKGLEDIFLAALSIGNPGLPLAPHVKEQVMPIARAIEPIMEPAHIDRLRGHFLRFVEEGGRTNLARWATSVDATCARAGLLLANDLGAASNVLTLEDKEKAAEAVNDLLVFVLSDRYAKLRRQIGVAVEA